MLAPSPGRRLGGWLLALALLLIVGEPLTLAQEVSRLLPTIGMHGPAAIALLLLRVIVAAFGVAAGLAILGRQPSAAGMAKLAVVLLGIVSLVVVLTPILPTNRLPGTTGPIVVIIAVYYGGWFLYLCRSRRVRRTFG